MKLTKFCSVLIMMMIMVAGVHSFGVKVTGGAGADSGSTQFAKPAPSNSSGVLAKAHSYGVVIDLGSKGSRVSVFTWPTSSKVPYTELEFAVDSNGDPCYYKITPGIANLADPTMAGVYLKPLLDYASSMIPSSQLSSTPIFIKGTDRLRQLNSTVVNIMISTIYSYTSANYNFLIKPQFVSLLPGLLEGAFMWISVNYLHNNFESGKDSDCIGSLDMGSGSTQIAFIPKKGTFVPYDYTFQFTYLDATYTPYVHSFRGYGYLGSLNTLNQISADSNGRNPCLLSGYTTSVIIRNQKVEVPGSGSWSGCSTLTYNYLNTTGQCAYPSCSFDGAFQPELHGDFLAVSNYYDVVSFLDLNPDSASPNDIHEAGVLFCSLTWDEAKLQYPSVDASDLASYCFGANYIYNLLSNGYKFDSSFDLSFGKTTKDGSPLTWAVGEMIYELQNGW